MKNRFYYILLVFISFDHEKNILSSIIINKLKKWNVFNVFFKISESWSSRWEPSTLEANVEMVFLPGAHIFFWFDNLVQKLFRLRTIKVFRSDFYFCSVLGVRIQFSYFRVREVFNILYAFFCIFNSLWFAQA